MKLIRKFFTRWVKPRDYHYLTYRGWFWRELAIFGCANNLWHIKYSTYGHECFCDFWDAQ